jgi:hypothetical protein
LTKWTLHVRCLTRQNYIKDKTPPIAVENSTNSLYNIIWNIVQVSPLRKLTNFTKNQNSLQSHLQEVLNLLIFCQWINTS